MQETHVLLRRKPSDVTDIEDAVRALSAGRSEQIGVDAPRQKERRFTCASLEHSASSTLGASTTRGIL